MDLLPAGDSGTVPHIEGTATAPSPAEQQPETTFAWCSLDPLTSELHAYGPKETMHLEAGLRSGVAEVTVMVRPEGLEHGLIAVVRFNEPSIGVHRQFTISGAGERAVRRVAGGASTVDFGDGVARAVPASAFMRFRRCAWVSVEPVQGILQPYTQENALIIEEAYNLKKKRVAVDVALPSGSLLRCTITFDFRHEKHNQSTGPGSRSVDRIARDAVGPEGVTIPLYRTPDDGTIDGLRYRLHGEEGFGEYARQLEQVGDLNVPEDVFMAETSLGADAFSTLKEFEIALGELGYSQEMLRRLAECMKEEPMRLAALVCRNEYGANQEVQLYNVIQAITNDWTERGLLGSPLPGPAMLGSMLRSLDEDHEEFPAVCSNLFVDWDPESETCRGLLEHQRGKSCKALKVSKLAAAALWQAVTGGGAAAPP